MVQSENASGGIENNLVAIMESDVANFADILPPFASEENKQLDAKVEENSRQRLCGL